VRKAPITLTLPPELKERLDATAVRNRRSRARARLDALENGRRAG
jgi:predicted transcriptional regulator